MKAIFFFLLLVPLTTQFVLAQPTKAEIDKMMKQAQEMMKKFSTDTNAAKIVKGMADQRVNNKPVSNGSLISDAIGYGNVDNWKFPAKNTELLSSLPKTVFTKPELLSFINAVYALLSKKLSAGVVSSVQSIAAKYNNDGTKMGYAAVIGWYTNYREESLLLILKAAAASPDNGLLLNNCAALLNMSGIEQMAIPILKYLSPSYPNDPMILNNIGQSYAGLGETDTAMVYLGRCIKAEPENPEANNTAGQIEAAKGNTEKAVGYFEQSIKGAYNKPAELKLHKIKKESNIAPLVRPRVKLPEYFNEFKYKLPAQCTSTDNAATAEADYKAFRAMMVAQVQKYSGKIAALQMKYYQNPPGAKNFKKDDFGAQPFTELCGIMEGRAWKEFEDGMNQYDKKFFADYENLEREYITKSDAIKKAGGESECKALEALGNKYLPKYAALQEDFQEKNQDFFKSKFDEVIYWGYLHYHPIGDDYFRKDCFYPAIVAYFGMLGKVANTKIIEPCEYEPTTATADTNEIKEIECPFDIEVPFIIGHFHFNCEKISLSGGEGAIFSYEKNFKTKQSTLSVGIGLKIWGKEAGIGPIKGKIGAGVSESLFITFDGNNKIADAGLKFSATASVGLEAEAEASAVKATKDIYKEGTGIGYTIGINSGLNFNEGFLKGMIGPAPEVQQNKNVHMYKPGN